MLHQYTLIALPAAIWLSNIELLALYIIKFTEMKHQDKNESKG